jgi:hypothetical protein
LKFFKLVQDGKFPLNNIAFELFLEIVQWFDKDESSFGSTSILPILSSRLKQETFCRSAVKFPSSFVKKLCRIGVETRLKGYKYFEIERDFFNKLGVLIDGHFKFGVLLLVFVRFLGGDTGNLYRNVFL